MKNVIIDSDVSSFIDDEFAIAYAINSKKLNVLAINTCPFSSEDKRLSFFDGMIDSYLEACRLCRLSKVKEDIVYKGSQGFVSKGYNEITPAVKAIKEICLKENKVYIACLGTLTNVAIAIQAYPEIINKIEIVWLGTQNLIEDTFHDSNYCQDKAAFEIVIKSGVKINVIPNYIGKFNASSIYEVKEHIATNPLGRHLYSIMEESKYNIENRGIRYIYDITVIAYLVNKNYFKCKKIDRNLLLKEQEPISKKTTLNYIYDGSTCNSVWKDFINTLSKAPTDVFASATYFISDTHFCQKTKIRTVELRIGDADKISHESIKRWNSLVGVNDTVYHLGDFGDYNIIKKLNGNVVLICGNHEEFDSNGDFEPFRKKLLKLGFKDVIEKNLILDKSVLGVPVNLTHKPENTIKGMFNLYGHVHTLKPVMKNGFNVCTEYHNFMPFSAIYIKDYIKFVESKAADKNVFKV